MLAKSAATACSFAEAPQINIDNSANGFAGGVWVRQQLKFIDMQKFTSFWLLQVGFARLLGLGLPPIEGAVCRTCLGCGSCSRRRIGKATEKGVRKDGGRKVFVLRSANTHMSLAVANCVFVCRDKTIVLWQANNKRKLLLSKSFSHTNFLVTFFPQR